MRRRSPPTVPSREASTGYPLDRNDPAAQLPVDANDYVPDTPPPPRTRMHPNNAKASERLVSHRHGSASDSILDLTSALADDESGGRPRQLGNGGAAGLAGPKLSSYRAERASPPVPSLALAKARLQDARGKTGEVASTALAYSVILDPPEGEPARATNLFITWPNGLKTGCSGALVGTKTVITASHCLYRASRGGWAASVMAVPAMDQQYMPFGEAYSVELHSNDQWVDYEDDDYDWGLIILDRHVGSAGLAGHHGVLAASNGFLDNQLIEINGYPASCGSGVRPCHTEGIVECYDSTMVYHDAQTSDGLSGAGITPWPPAYDDYVVSVNTGTDYNLWCLSLSLARSTRITDQRLNYIMAVRDNPNAPEAPSNQSNWAWHEGFPDAPVAMVSPGANKFDIYIRGIDNAVWLQRYENAVWSPSMTTWTSIGGQVVGRVAAVSRATDQVDLFVREKPAVLEEQATRICTKARYQSNWWPSQTQWSCFTDFNTLEWPSATSTDPGRLHVFAVGANRRVYEKAWTSAAGWLAPIDLGGNTQHPVAVVSRAQFIWDAFIRDASTGQICTKSRNGASFWPSQTTWACLANSQIVGAPVAVKSGTNALDVVGIDNAGRLKRMYWRGAGWLGPMDLGGTFSVCPSCPSPDVAAVSRTSNQLDFFGRDVSGGIRTKSFNGTSWWPSQSGSWASLAGDGIDVSAVSFGSNRLDVITRGRNDNAVRHRWWNGQQWWP